MCVDSTRGRDRLALYAPALQASAFRQAMLAIMHNIANSGGDQAWLVSFSIVASVAGPQALPSDKCARDLLSNAAAQGLPGLVITTVTGAMRCSSCITFRHSQLEKHQQVLPSGTKLHCMLCKSLAPCLP